MAKDDHHHQPRLCHVVKVDTFDGYGFNLLAEQGRQGQYIGKVDEGSPAELAGLRRGDKILEVNGVSIADDNHKQVVQKIKAVPGETRLLVVDEAKDLKEEATKNGQKQQQQQEQPQQTPPPPPKLDLGITAAEMRARLAANKRTDPRAAANNLDFKSKFDLVQKL